MPCTMAKSTVSWQMPQMNPGITHGGRSNTFAFVKLHILAWNYTFLLSRLHFWTRASLDYCDNVDPPSLSIMVLEVWMKPNFASCFRVEIGGCVPYAQWELNIKEWNFALLNFNNVHMFMNVYETTYCSHLALVITVFRS